MLAGHLLSPRLSVARWRRIAEDEQVLDAYGQIQASRFPRAYSSSLYTAYICKVFAAILSIAVAIAGPATTVTALAR